MANEIPIDDPNVSAPGLDAELDAALSNAFKASSSEPPKEALPISKNESKPIEKEAAPPKKELLEKAGKTPEQDKQPVTTPEEVQNEVPEDQSAWNALRQNYKKSKNLAKDREETIKKLETALAEKGTTTTKEVEDLKAKIQELSKYQATTDLQTDPEFVSKFDAPIQEKVDSLKSILKEWSISDEVINKIDFSNKQTLGAIAKAIRANQENITSEFSIEEFMANARDVIELHKKKNAALDEHGKNYKQVLEEKKKQSFAKSAEDEGRTLKHFHEVAASKDQAGNAIFPFLNKQTPKENALPAEVAQIEAHNKFVDTMYQQIDSEIKSNDPERKAKLVVAAAGAHYLNAQLKTVVAKLKAVEAELAKVSTAGNESEKSKIKGNQRNGNGSREREMDLDTALTAHFSQAR